MTKQHQNVRTAGYHYRVVINIRVHESTFQWLAGRADEAEVPVSTMARTYLEAAQREEKTPA